jgi:zinc protease
MFQLVYLAFTAPRPDPTAFAVLAGQAKAMLANQRVVPEMAFIETLQSTMTQDHPRRRLTTAETVDQWNLDRSLQFYKDRFADAGDFTFVFVGSFTADEMRPMVERYLGALPSTGRKETWKDVGVRAPGGVVTKTVEKGTEPKSQTAIIFTGPFEYDQTQRVMIRAMAQVLQAKLLESLREELGGTYSVTAGASYNRFPRPEYSVTIQFGSDPARVDALVARVFDEIDRLKTNGPTAAHVTDTRESLLRDFETNIRQNAFLLGQIVAKYQAGEDAAQLWEVPEYYKKVDVAALQQAARTYLNRDRLVRVTLLPEKR